MNRYIKLIALLITLVIINSCESRSSNKNNSKHGLVNTPPTTQSQIVKLNSINSVKIILKATDKEGDKLSYIITKQPKHGILKGKAPNLVYIPNKGFSGKDSFSYIVSDGKEKSKEAEVVIYVKSSNATKDNNNSSSSNKDTNTTNKNSNTNKDNNSTKNNNTNNNSKDNKKSKKDKNSSIEFVDIKSNITIPYNTITLKIKSNSSNIALYNKTLLEKEKRLLKIKGYKQKNSNISYFYNVPLIKGENQIRFTLNNKELKSITINSDYNKTLPIALKSSNFRAIKELNTTLSILTLLQSKKILLDKDGDGIIDKEITPSTIYENNQTIYKADINVSYIKEGRYKPRVTIQTVNNLLFSTPSYTLSLDVVSNKNQKDPKGAQPIDVAKEFIEALLEDDRVEVERLVGNSKSIIKFIYEDSASLKKAKQIAQHIKPNSWKQTYRPNGSIEVTAEANDPQYGIVPLTIEIMYATGDYNGQGRMLYISDLH